MVFYKNSWWLDSNPGPLVAEATALGTVQQPLPNEFKIYKRFDAPVPVYFTNKIDFPFLKPKPTFKFIHWITTGESR